MGISGRVVTEQVPAGAFEAALAIAEKRTRLMVEMKDAIERGDSGRVVTLARKLTGTPTVKNCRVCSRRLCQKGGECIGQSYMEVLFNLFPFGVAIARDRACNRITVTPELGETLGLEPGENFSAHDPAHSLRWANPGGRELKPADLPMQVAIRTEKEVLCEELVAAHRRDSRKLKLVASAAPVFDHAGRCIGAVAGLIRTCHAVVAQYLLVFSSTLTLLLDYYDIVDLGIV